MTNFDSTTDDLTNRPDDPSNRSDTDPRTRVEDSSKKSRVRSRRKRSPAAVDQDQIQDATLASGSGQPSKSIATTGDTVATPRYHNIGEVGRGGWGIVEKAIDRQLDREVAVKRFTDADDVTIDERRRFLHEAKVTSQLQHPGIVPVHELGDQEGAFYVMKLLDGITLQEFVHRHHNDRQRDQTQNRFQFGESLEPLLQRFVDVCNAVAYAHQRGVVHRDLKPSNVMIGEFGETVVLDWGLAQTTGMSAASPQPPHNGRGLNFSAEVSSLTEPDGTVVGTPAFMSPEQAAGEIAAIGQPSDIYSLGVILYVLIAGRHPYQGQPVEEILKQVKATTHPSLRSLQPLAPSSLVSIVQKAMSANPNDRYATAELLAQDVRRFIAGDAVSVHQETAIERSIRWCRHHQGIAATIAICVLTLTIAAIGFGIVIKQAHRAERIARIEAERSHREAIFSLGEAREATDVWLTELSGSLQFYPGMKKVQAELLQRAIDQYDRIEKQNVKSSNVQVLPEATELAPSDTFLRHTDRMAILERAKETLRLGDLYRLTGKKAQALDHYLAAERLLKVHATSDPAWKMTPDSSTGITATNLRIDYFLDSQFELEQINSLIGKLLIKNTMVSDSSSADFPSSDQIARARRWLQQKTEPHFDETDTAIGKPLDGFAARTASALVRMELALHSANAATQPDCEHFEQAIRLARWLAERSGTVGNRRLSETIQTEACRQRTKAGQHQIAVHLWTVLIDDLSHWLKTAPDRIDYLQTLGCALLQRGICWMAIGQHDDASSDFESSIVKIKLVRQLTDNDRFCQEQLTTAETNLAQLLGTGKTNTRESIEHTQAPTSTFQTKATQDRSNR
ncbi:serine/threonine-protein kinase [Rubripirellula reticaptiva]|uniref:Serine/threonine-protein kinase PknD n=1 Tax=Rubripirellula reticaptiva TaxID=2528013 RepID=A0A5C6F6P4_9BACT|nr:serine/threonine-protein kinase [Rubripirellula reticaptiva]TWU56077.1 Serine/threonine-protein kinase PknD [Rubripirellula reticaptiva]